MKQSPASDKPSDETLDQIATIFSNGFLAGFSAAFDGWNGESFAAFDRAPADSEEFRAALESALTKFMLALPSIMAELKEYTTAFDEASTATLN